MKIYEMKNKQHYGLDKEHTNVANVVKKRILDLDDRHRQDTITLECYQDFEKLVYIGMFDLAYPETFSQGYLIADKLASYLILLSNDFTQLALLDFTGEVYYIGSLDFYGVHLDEVIKQIKKNFKNIIDNIKKQ